MMKRDRDRGNLAGEPFLAVVLGALVAACGATHRGGIASDTLDPGAGSGGDRAGAAGSEAVASAGAENDGVDPDVNPNGTGDGGPRDDARPSVDGATPGNWSSCKFHDSPAPDAGPGSGVPVDAGADGGTVNTVTIETSAFVGPYLADIAGRTLYTYAADSPGDCNRPPSSGCETDCVTAWPLFDAGVRVLAPGLDPGAFGSVVRADGLSQTAYFGWPLYYNKTDLTKGQMAGQGKGGKTWHAATVVPANIVILKVGTAKFLADGGGRTFYSSDQDTKGSAAVDPVSACDAACLLVYPHVFNNRIWPVSSLLTNDFTLFVRPSDGSQQVAYKGAPLYYAGADEKPGDTKGAIVPGWAVVAP